MADSGWSKSTLGEHVDLLTGYPFKSEKYVDDLNAIKLLRGDNVVQGRLRWENVKRWPMDEVDGLDDYFLDDGDVVLAMDRPWIEAGLKYAAVKKGDLPVLLVQRVSRIRGGPKLCIGFLRYLIGSTQFTDHVLGVQTGTAVPHISAKQIKAFEFLRPPIEEQFAIAEILGSLDDKIELNRRTNQVLESMARAIFKAWFIDFEPVKAKAAGAKRFPYMPQQVFDDLPETLVDSELGEIPEGWEVVELDAVTSLCRETLNPSDFPYELFDHYSIPAFDKSAGPSCELGSTIKSNKHVIPPSCILVSKLNPRIPRVWLPSERCANRRRISSTEFMVTVPTKGWSRYELYCHITSSSFIEHMTRTASGTSNSHQRVKPKDFQSMPIVSAPEFVRAEFAGMIESMFQKIDANECESQILAAVRDALLPKLISGELAVLVTNGGSDGG